jgi:pyruvate dehydrogenase E2 component (dihydrolipoamide acetyltransferase)
MPSLGADMEYGTLVEWRVRRGDAVKRGDIVALVETQKGLFEVESAEEGTIETLLVEPGTRAAVGAVLAEIRAAGEAHAEARAAPAPAPAATAPATAVAAKSAGPAVRASPIARRLAAEKGIDLAQVAGSGPGGAITQADVERFAGTARATPVPGAEAKPEAKPSPEGERAFAMRQAIAAAVSRSKREIPHYYLATDISLDAALRWLETYNRNRPVHERALPAVLMIKAVATALRKHPEFNGFWIDGAFRAGSGIHPGIAVSLRGGGLIVPAIRDAEQKSIEQLTRELSDVITRARESRLRASDMGDATITITNLGDTGVETVFGVIYPPQVALVGFGRITERVWAEHGLPGVRPVVTATLAADHRATDGHRGSLFLSEIARALEDAESL